MPLRGTGHSSLTQDNDPYFKSLSALDDFMDNHPEDLNVTPRFPDTDNGIESHHGKLLVCHDYKGGYTERPDALSYTFNFWSMCDTFIYFSHHRVTIPPSGWTAAAHRQGVKMLGTLIFEGSGEEDCLRLLVGRLPKTQSGSAAPSHPSSWSNIPLSAHYARRLATLARQRGFDGYLLNFECPLRAGAEQVRALAAWIGILREELYSRVGTYAEVIWYDSVVITGQLRWQDRLNAFNLPFFLPSTGFFTNYTWPAHYPNLTAQYFLSLDGTSAAIPPSIHLQKIKALNDVFVGIDVWGRGSHGGGGFGSFRALAHIDPRALGLSAALFGPAWTWESEQDLPGWNWHQWWARERTLWVGPPHAGDVVPVPDAPLRKGEPECPHGAFRPLTDFFEARPAPNPKTVALCTTFSPGVGWAWFVRGRQVLHSPGGWTDVGKQSSLGNLVWPRPVVAWEDGPREMAQPAAAADLCVTDAWLGGSSLRLTLSDAGVSTEDAENAAFRCMWIPVQSFRTTPGQAYTAILVYKLEGAGTADVDIGFSVKGITGTDVDVSTTADAKELGEGWVQLSVDFVTAREEKGPCISASAAGLVVAIASEDPTQPLLVSILLGQLAVFYSHGISSLEPVPKALWAAADVLAPTGAAAEGLVSTLTWDVGFAFHPLLPAPLPDSEDPKPIFSLPAVTAAPSLLYVNVYAEAHSPNGGVNGPDNATFVGTSGLDGHAQRLRIEGCMLPEDAKNAKVVRFYVQGVTERGEVLPWERCAFADWRRDLQEGE